MRRENLDSGLGKCRSTRSTTSLPQQGLRNELNGPHFGSPSTDRQQTQDQHPAEYKLEASWVLLWRVASSSDE